MQGAIRRTELMHDTNIYEAIAVIHVHFLTLAISCHVSNCRFMPAMMNAAIYSEEAGIC